MKSPRIGTNKKRRPGSTGAPRRETFPNRTRMLPLLSTTKQCRIERLWRAGDFVFVIRIDFGQHHGRVFALVLDNAERTCLFCYPRVAGAVFRTIVFSGEGASWNSDRFAAEIVGIPPRVHWNVRVIPSSHCGRQDRKST